MNISNPATVFYWKRKGKIPRWRHDQVLAAALRHEIDLTDVDELKGWPQ